MNKLNKITAATEIDLYLDDIFYLQDSIIDAILGITKLVGQDNYILSGCGLTIGTIAPGESNIAWADGYIVIGGEVCKVIANDIDINDSDRCYWVIEETNSSDASSNRPDQNNNTVNFYKVRIAKLVTSDGTVHDSDYLQMQTRVFREIIRSQGIGYFARKEMSSQWRTLVPYYANGWEDDTTAADGIAIRFRKDEFGYLEISGYINAQNATAGHAFTLPAGYRPNHQYLGMVFYSASAQSPITINPNGQVSILEYSGPDYYYVNLRIPLT